MSSDLKKFIDMMALFARGEVTENSKPLKYHDILKLLKKHNVQYRVEFGSSENDYVEKDSFGNYKLVIYSRFLLENNKQIKKEYIRRFGKNNFKNEIKRELKLLYKDNHNYIYENIVLGIGVICLEEFLVDERIPIEYKILFNQYSDDSIDKIALEYFKSIFTIPDKLFVKLINENIRNYNTNEYLVSSSDIAKKLKLTYETVNNRFNLN